MPLICLAWTARTCASGPASTAEPSFTISSEILDRTRPFNSARRSKVQAPSSVQRKASIYRGGPSKDWLKTKAYITREYVVIGYEHKRDAAPSLLLADMVEGKLRYVGRAIPTAGKQRSELWEALDYLRDAKFAVSLGASNKGAVPVQPVLRVKAKHLKGEDKLLHATVIEVLVP